MMLQSDSISPTRMVAMNPRRRVPIWLILTSMLFLLAMGALVFWHSRQMPPALDEICGLARQHQYAQAQELMVRYLRAFPGDNRAHLLMAQFAMDRPDPQPQRALEHLGQIHGASMKETAVVRFSEGKAHYQEKRYDLAEACWKQALELDPVVPEAGWALLDLLDFEGRVEEAHQLGMHLYETEPDPRDRIRLLLEMTRLDIDKIAPGSQVQVFKPAWEANPENLPLAITVGLALVHDSRSAEGIEVLHDALQHHPDSADAWDSWLTGLDDGFQPEQLRQEYARLPRALVTDPRFAKHEGTVAQGLQDWPRAIAAFRRACAFEPFNGVVLYRFRMALRAGGEMPEFNQIDRALTTYQNAYKQMRSVHTEALAIRTLGMEPHTDLYHRLATLREQVGRFDEARAWHHLVLRDVPDDALSLAALVRLK